ncbi:hypothetical protein P3W85_40520 [Cupriavidus basilensis]|uniref:Uncharacterized protein n=1 Tax=Cupriavidus basilensis TaxID=68895 RepID=A0ABT6B2S1_9BURK|nr:hypothetical protein [Cupriavidus basilensis]MDF3839179.1 hypothetical protein [Cupriavidus basilensis]
MNPAPTGGVLRAIAIGQRVVVIEEDTADARLVLGFASSQTR